MSGMSGMSGTSAAPEFSHLAIQQSAIHSMSARQGNYLCILAFPARHSLG